MLAYFSDEPIIKTLGNNSSGYANYNIYRITGMQGDQSQNGYEVYSTSVYAPDGYDDVELGSLMRNLLETQELNIKRLQFWNYQDCSITQSTFAFNTYLTVNDLVNGTTEDFSVIYDTRGERAEDLGVTYYNSPYQGYCANYFPEQEIMEGQYFSLMYRQPSNSGEMSTYEFGRTIAYTTRATPEDPSINVMQDVSIMDITGQTFRYSGNVSWQSWSNDTDVIWVRFYIKNEKGTKTYIGPQFYPKWCEEPNTVYLYWVNSMGGIDFVRSTETFTTTKNHEDSTYETNIGLEKPRDFGEEVYHQRKWNSYTFSTKLVSDTDSPALADVCGARWAWLYFPGRTQPWVPVTVEDAQATVKNFENQGKKLYNYTFQLRDNKKIKTI